MVYITLCMRAREEDSIESKTRGHFPASQLVFINGIYQVRPILSLILESISVGTDKTIDAILRPERPAIRISQQAYLRLCASTDLTTPSAIGASRFHPHLHKDCCLR